VDPSEIDVMSSNNVTNRGRTLLIDSLEPNSALFQKPQQEAKPLNLINEEDPDIDKDVFTEAGPLSSPPDYLSRDDLNDRAPATNFFSNTTFQEVRPQGGVPLYTLTVPEQLKQPAQPQPPQHLKPVQPVNAAAV